ncbi:FtsX-like permease family protein [Pseudactinotalea sp.]|uniref:FtsX-like permease family protein n=1 Tax=Pseudactinotalea sp. TaxID=1926260 RepID=UPI003B3B9B40
MRARLLLRQATSSIGASIAIAVIVAVAAGLFTAWPRLARTTEVAEFNYRISQTPAATRDLSGREVGSWLNGGFAEALDALEAAAAAAGPTLQPLLGPPQIMLSIQGMSDPLPFDTEAPGPSDVTGRELQFRASPSFADHVTIIDGEAPEPWLPGPEGVAPVPMMVSTRTAERLGVEPGEVLTLSGNTIVTAEGAVPLTAIVTGTFEAVDEADTFWEHHVSGLVPYNRGDPDKGDIFVGAAYTHPDTANALPPEAGLLPTIDVWFPLDTGADNAGALLDDLREMTARETEIAGSGLGAPTIQLETALVDVLTATIIAQRGAAAVLTLIVAGPIGVTFALLALTTRLSVSRRRPTLALASARGGSPVLLRGALGLEGLVVGLPAALLGAAVATVAIPGPLHGGDYLLALLVALAPAAFLAAEPLPNLRTQRQDLSSRSPSRWRWVAETLVVATAAGAVYLLLSRGLQATTTSSVDPLATATPLLVSFATAVLATRAFPLPMRVVHAAMRRRRGIAGFLGSARAIREGGVGMVPMLALLVATSIAVFSTTLLTTLSHGVRETAYSATGADVRLSGPPYFDDLVADVAAVPGVAGVARVYSDDLAQLTADGTTQRVTIYAVDTAALSTVQSGITGAVSLPAGMGELVDDTVPIVVSPAIAAAPEAELSLYMPSVVPVSQVAVEPTAAGLVDEARWVMADIELLREATGQPLIPRLLLVDLGPDADQPAAVEALSAAVDGTGTLTAASAREADFLESPSAGAMQQGAAAALVVSLLQSVLALVLTLVLAAPARRRLVAVLRTLGLGARDARRLVSWELVPLAAVALAGGAVLGLLLPHLVVATVDLSAFTGQASPPVVYDWPRLAIVLAVVVAVVGLTLLIASAIARRLSLSVLRIGDAT